MKSFVYLLILSFAVNLMGLDPYTMSLDDCKNYIKVNNLTWEAGITPYSYLPKEILKPMLTGFYLPIKTDAKINNKVINSKTDKPEYLDWTNKNGTNWMTSVKNQGSYSGSWAFATLGTWEAMININSNDPDIDWDGSEQYLISCYQTNLLDEMLAGSGPARWIMVNGVPDEACYPYRASAGNCNDRCSDWRERLKFIKSVTDVCTNPDTEAIKAALRNGPVGSAMQVNLLMLRFYRGGVLGEETPSTDIGYPINHEVVIVGWDDARNGGSWKWKNCWGAAWGEGGYGWTQFGTSQIGYYSWSCTAYSEGTGYEKESSARTIPLQFNFTITPNPVKTTAVVNVMMPERSKANISLFDLLGKHVLTIDNSQLSRGINRIVLNAKDLKPGIYIARINAGKYIDSKAILINK
ncbi:MAG: T9SS type A sorting domain-containing protein [Candidatus Coatesbacteria bacterium]|nr:T9SS type A sorting domain-containing protein [Candidatus Coatesbacteria bacterium]